ncbi:MAG: damage-inducible protein CinA [Bacteroidetes bacterium GWC2_33_15]|nr:MAG: damage-inducible protein CinA [Bacteroidetes bacterium GWA2_33_15]OFX50630.1 MAG: damage-inducible protein CinA [Bacteroidetes bacterium GWC2_33_15]OFX64167.1 MAG: damage-inducible protein CinA [Bacteroidetes bacterium GWB2_32_14]OFX69779.1 MAG: damage-inducible protein CinA [Bacteroidetes bacterium GWD2_33_33]HAN19818.1 competence/damage-inducible protein A [Bacteroidales bacterium]
MKAEIITIGDEILIGQIIDTNSAWIANELNLIGIDVVRKTSVSDNKDEIIKAIDYAKSTSDIILLTGGLGPTNDDYTKETLAEYYKVELIENAEVLKHISQLITKNVGVLNQRNIDQAKVPANCIVIHNSVGTAPGMWFNDRNKIIISMPGVPFEVKEMMTTTILPKLKNLNTDSVIIHKIILTQGIPESRLAEVLESWENNLPREIKLAYLPSPGLIKLRLSARGNNKAYLQDLIDEQVTKIQQVIPDTICGYDSELLEEIVGNLLLKTGKTLSIAESCTGGYISQLITSIPGSSAYFKGSIVAYSNEIKENILNVSKSNIDIYGAVSKQVVEEMVTGIRRIYNTDYSIATSGISGPAGGSIEKPVGTTWIAIADKNGVISMKYTFGDHRGRNIARASLTALNMLQKRINGIKIDF